MSTIAVDVEMTAGTLATITGTFMQEGTTTLTDPTSVLLFYKPPGGSKQSASVTHVSTGIYQAELDTTGWDGVVVAYWQGTGTCQVTQPFTFPVDGLPI